MVGVLLSCDLVSVVDTSYCGMTWMKGSSYRCSPSNISLGDIQTPNSLHILLENMGRINYGHAMNDSKGMDSVSLNGDELVGSWGACPLPLDGAQLDTLAKQTWANVTAPTEGPTLYRAMLDIQEPADTFVVMDGWHKGSVWINGFNLGRYWLDKGPLNYLYANRRSGGVVTST